MIATSIEQSQKLIDAGLDPSSADMAWGHIDFGGVLQVDLLPLNPHIDKKSIIAPAWSVGMLWEIAKDTYPCPTGVCSECNILEQLVTQVSAGLQFGSVNKKYLAK